MRILRIWRCVGHEARFDGERPPLVAGAPCSKRLPECGAGILSPRLRRRVHVTQTFIRTGRTHASRASLGALELKNARREKSRKA